MIFKKFATNTGTYYLNANKIKESKTENKFISKTIDKKKCFEIE